MHRLLARWGLLLAMTVCLAPSLAAQEIKVFKLAARYNDFALDPESGNVAAIDPKAGTVELYRSGYFDGDATAKSEPLKVGNVPSAIVYKKFKQRGVFAIACLDDMNLYLIDAAKFELLRKIPLEKLGAERLACTVDPADPYVYYSLENDHHSSLGRVNLSKLQDEGELLGTRDFALSARGNAFYLSDHGLSYWRKIENGGKPRFERLFQSHDASRDVVVDTRETVVAVGDEIRTADLSKRLARLGFRPLAFHPELPLILGVPGEGASLDQLFVASANTFQTLAKASLPALPAPPRKPGRRFADENEEPDDRVFYNNGQSLRFVPRVLTDAKGKRLIVAHLGTAHAVPLASLKLPEEPWMRVDLPAIVELAVDANAKLPVAKADPRLEVSLLDPAAGAVLNKGVLEIKPTASDVGQHELHLLLKHGALEVIQNLTLRIAHPHTKLPIRPNLLAVDPTGSKIVCAQSVVGRLGEGGQRVTHIAVVDGATRQVTRALSAPLMTTAIATDDTNMYLADAHDLSVAILPLAEGKAKTLAIHDHVQSISVVPGKLLYLDCGGNKVRRFDWKEGIWIERAAPDPDADERWHFGRPLVIEAPRPLAGGWKVDGLLYDQQLARVRLIHRLQEAFQESNGYPHPDERQPVPALSAWSHAPAKRERRGWDESPMAEVELAALPALVAGSVTESDRRRGDGNERLVNVQLAVRALTQAGERELIPLAKDLPLRERDPEEEHRFGTLFGIAGNQALVPCDDRLFWYDLAMIDASRYPRPLTIALEQSALSVDLKQKTKLTHKISAPPGKWSAQITDKPAYLSIDPATAEITVDGPAAAAHFSQQLFTDLEQLERRVEETPEDEGKTKLPPYLLELKARAAEEFERITGQKATGLVHAIPIHLKVTTSDGTDSATLEYQVLADVPPADLEQRWAAQQKRAGEEIARHRAQGVANSPEGQARRLSQLEERMRAIESKLDRLTELLTKDKPDKP